MYSSLKFLFRSPYNKKHPFFAICRFVEWKFIKLFKLTDYKKKVWGDRYLFLNYDSFQSMWVMYNWIVDWEEFNLIKDLVRRNDHCLDIGANMGFYTIWLSKFTEKTISFEPDNKNFQRLSSNIRLNGLTHSTALNIAVGTDEGPVNFTNNRDGENHISLSGNTDTGTVQCRRLDNVLTEHDITRVRYMKIDVEGFELAVLEGANDLLREKRVDIIQVEINAALVNSGASVTGLLEFISSHGYKLYSYDVKNRKLVQEQYSPDRENYFLTYDAEMINNSLN
ncbi:MAG: FkbM family methyltransferase [Ferruginibacter sp.]